MLEQVKEILAEELNVDMEEINPNTDIREDLDADSLDMVQIVMALEDAFDVEIDNAEISEVRTVQDIISYIEKKKG